MSDAGLAPLLDRLRGLRLLVVGDVMLDLYVQGRVERISPEAPIPVLQIESETARPGGAGNVAVNLAALGADVRLVGLAGPDAAGVALEEALGEPVRAVLVRDGARQTTTKTRYLAGHQQLLRADRELRQPVSGPIEARLIAAIEAEIPRAAAVVLSDYGKGCLTGRVIRAAIDGARAAGLPVVVDPSGTDFGRYAGATLLKPNRAEIAAATGIAVRDDESATRAARAARRQARAEALLLSRAEAGVTLVAGRRPAIHFAAIAREVADVTGAGDSVVAAAAAALAAGASLEQAAALANIAGGIAVGHVGAYAVTSADLGAALRTGVALATTAKIVTVEAAAAIVARWRRENQKVGFTNGVFDLLHPGHLALIEEARSACDRLIVAINADASVRRLKGPGRPVQGENARALVLAALADVALVIVFDTDTPIPLLERLRPDVLVKGADYTLDRVVGADVVRGYGGEVRLARFLPGHSTTATMRKLPRVTAQADADIAVVGGGITGLWTLDTLVRAGFSALLVEATGFGAGQTMAAQGIIHGGAKYEVERGGAAAARGIAAMPARWRAALAGQAAPDLRGARLAAEQHLLFTRGLGVRTELAGRLLAARRQRLPREAWPRALAQVPEIGRVIGLDEPVVDIASVLAALAVPHMRRIRRARAVAVAQDAAGATIALRGPRGRTGELRARLVVLAAGAGNALLPGARQQARPLHMLMARGAPGPLFAHMIAGAMRPALTITSHAQDGAMLWYLGGDLAERGVRLESDALIAEGRALLARCFGADIAARLGFATRRIDRIEGAMPRRRRPDGPVLQAEGRILAVWPTKLALAPAAADQACAWAQDQIAPAGAAPPAALSDWPQPELAAPPWAEVEQWR